MADSKSPFTPSFLKIERAERHIQELANLIEEFLATEPVKVSSDSSPKNMEVDGPSGKRTVVALSWNMHFSPVPRTLSPVIGDVFHNLRSALDLMAGTLVRIQKESPDNVYFPFAKDEASLDDQIKDKNFYKAGDAAIKLLKEFQPYKGGNIELRAIHDLNVRDKHRELIVQQLSGAGPIIDTRPDDGSPFKFVGDPNKPSAVELVFPADCALAGKELVSTLHHLVKVTTSIVKAFEALSAPAG